MPKEKIVAKVYHQKGEVMFAACDSELLGKHFEEGDLQITVHTSFYDGFSVDEISFIQYLQTSTIVNLVGENVIECAKKAGFITEDCILRIQGIPHAQIYRMT